MILVKMCLTSCSIIFWTTKYNTPSAFGLAAYCAILLDLGTFGYSSLHLLNWKLAFDLRSNTGFLYITYSRFAQLTRRRRLSDLIKIAPYPLYCYSGGLRLTSFSKDLLWTYLYLHRSDEDRSWLRKVVLAWNGQDIATLVGG